MPNEYQDAGIETIYQIYVLTVLYMQISRTTPVPDIKNN